MLPKPKCVSCGGPLRRNMLSELCSLCTRAVEREGEFRPTVRDILDGHDPLESIPIYFGDEGGR